MQFKQMIPVLAILLCWHHEPVHMSLNPNPQVEMFFFAFNCAGTFASVLVAILCCALEVPHLSKSPLRWQHIMRSMTLHAKEKPFSWSKRSATPLISTSRIPTDSGAGGRCCSGASLSRKFFMGTATANIELQWSVVEFVTEQHSRLMGVTTELVKWKASDIAHDMGISWGSSKRLVGGRDGLCARTAFPIWGILAMQIKWLYTSTCRWPGLCTALMPQKSALGLLGMERQG